MTLIWPGRSAVAFEPKGRQAVSEAARIRRTPTNRIMSLHPQDKVWVGQGHGQGKRPSGAQR